MPESPRLPAWEIRLTMWKQLERFESSAGQVEADRPKIQAFAAAARSVARNDPDTVVGDTHRMLVLVMLTPCPTKEGLG